MNLVKCSECTMLDKCPSGQRCSKLIKNFMRLCPVGKTKISQIKIIEIYEYGNGTYAEPFWIRVQKKIDKVEEKYKIIKREEIFIPSHYVGENCMGHDVFRGDELFLTLYCEEL